MRKVLLAFILSACLFINQGGALNYQPVYNKVNQIYKKDPLVLEGIYKKIIYYRMKTKNVAKKKIAKNIEKYIKFLLSYGHTIKDIDELGIDKDFGTGIIRKNGKVYCNDKSQELNVEYPYNFQLYTSSGDNDFYGAYRSLYHDGVNLYYQRPSICTTGIPPSCFSCDFGKLPYDPFTFTNLRGEFVKDKNGVYFYGNKIKNIDIATYEILDDDKIKDKDSIYFCDFEGCYTDKK